MPESSKLPFAAFGHDGPGGKPVLIAVLSTRFPRAAAAFNEVRRAYGAWEVFMARVSDGQPVGPHSFDLREKPNSALRHAVEKDLARRGISEPTPQDVIQAYHRAVLRADVSRSL